MTATTDGWELPDELVELRDSVATFMRREVLPLEEQLPSDAYKVPDDQLAELHRKARQSGLWCMQTPAEYGGAGLSNLGECVVAEEAAKCRMGAYVPALGAFGWDPPNIIFDGTKEQIERYALPAIEHGDRKTFVAISEASGGSDPGRSISTRAERDGDSWVLNGTKLWISGADTARWGIVFARTRPGRGRDGIGCFIVDTDTPGFSARPVEVIRAWSPCEVHFEDCRIPSQNLLGEEGKGFQVAERWLLHARPPYAAGTIGIAQAALDLAVDYAKQRETFGSVLAAKQAVQWMVADSEIELRAARLLVYQAAWLADMGKDFKTASSVAKVYATETAGRVVDRCIQVLGGMGVSKEMPLERWYRELRIKRIGEGPSEVHRMVVARSLLGKAMKG
ncbi:MAG: acyl-CoA dehydrogenase [Streptosporangiales bacterium]|nr:acyl-CoA dehydrogenase [Streptosporangiales bacterium]